MVLYMRCAKLRLVAELAELGLMNLIESASPETITRAAVLRDGKTGKERSMGRGEEHLRRAAVRSASYLQNQIPALSLPFLLNSLHHTQQHVRWKTNLPPR